MKSICTDRNYVILKYDVRLEIIYFLLQIAKSIVLFNKINYSPLLFTTLKTVNE